MATYINQGSDFGALGQTIVYTTSAVATVCPLTMACWLNPDSAWSGADAKILNILDTVPSSADHLGITIETTGTVTTTSQWRSIARVNDFLFFESSATSYVDYNEWHHIAATFDGTTNQPTAIIGYMDGVAGPTNSNPSNLSPDGLNTTCIAGIGPSETDNRCYRSGCIADAAIWNVVLTPAEVAQLAAGARPNEVQPGNLILWLKMTDAATATVNEVGNNYASQLAPSGGEISTCETSPPYEPEPPTPSSTGESPYYIERMDNRIWPTIEDAWCLDSALEYPMPTPDATLAVSSSTGDQNITEYNIINGGSGYTSPTAQITDIAGGGESAVCTLGVTGGVITSAEAAVFGSGYLHPTVTVFDTTGVGAVIQPIITNYVTLTASTSSFTASDVGSIVRSGGGRMEIVTVSTVTTATANMLSPITYTVPNDPHNSPVPVRSGQWSMTAPTMTVSGLWHLEGLTVAALADGGVVTDLTVEDGSVTLPVEATQILVGLPFTAQLQTMYMDAGAGPTVQTRRKELTQVVLRVENSRAPEVGVNQPDAAAQPNQAETPWGFPTYSAMTQVKDRTPQMPAGQPIPLYSGDLDITNLFGSWDQRGQIAVQQRNPVPLTVVALIPWLKVGDTPGQ